MAFAEPSFSAVSLANRPPFRLLPQGLPVNALAHTFLHGQRQKIPAGTPLLIGAGFELSFGHGPLSDELEGHYPFEPPTANDALWRAQWAEPIPQSPPE